MLKTLLDLDLKYSMLLFKLNAGIFYNFFAYASSVVFMEETCIVTLGLIFFILDKNIKIFAIYMTCFGFGVLSTVLCKKLIGRARPDMKDIGKTVKAAFFRKKQSNGSLPSGDTLQAWILFLTVNQFKPNIFNIIFFQLAISISFSRIYLCCHFVSDIIAGILMAYIIFYSVLAISKSDMVDDFLDNGVEMIQNLVGGF